MTKLGYCFLEKKIVFKKNFCQCLKKIYSLKTIPSISVKRGKKDGLGVRERDKRRNRYKQRERESKSGERMRKERKKKRDTDQAGF